VSVKVPRIVRGGKGSWRWERRGPGVSGEDGLLDCVGSGGKDGGARGRLNLTTLFLYLFCSGGIIPRALRTAHAEGRAFHLLWGRPRAEAGFLFPLCHWWSCTAGLHIPWG